MPESKRPVRHDKMGEILVTDVDMGKERVATMADALSACSLL